MHLTSKLSHPNIVGLLAHATTGAGTLAAASGGAAALDPEEGGSPISWAGAGRANGHADRMPRVSLDGVPREEARRPLKSTGIEVYSASDMDASRWAAYRARRRGPPSNLLVWKSTQLLTWMRLAGRRTARGGAAPPQICWYGSLLSF